MLRKLAAAVCGALVAGVLVGAVARLMMLLVALGGGDSSHFTWSGTLGIVLAFAVFMLPGALLAAFVRRRGRWALLAAGAVALLLPAVGVASDEVGFTGHFTPLNWVLVGLSGLGVFATIAVLPVVTLRLVDRWSGFRAVSSRRTPVGRASRTATAPWDPLSSGGPAQVRRP